MQLRLNECCQFIINEGQDFRLKIFAMFHVCFAMKIPVYKPEDNKLARMFWLKNELFQPRGYMNLPRSKSP